METIGITTTRYSVVLKRILEAYNEDVVIRIDGRVFGPHDIPTLLASWCTNRQITHTINFSLSREGKPLFSFHDHPRDLFAAQSEQVFLEQLVADRLARLEKLKPTQSCLRYNNALHLTPAARLLSRLVQAIASRCLR